jgi:triacylglycerol esterase/lipase EstA (alpha/beta hydrolase family)
MRARVLIGVLVAATLCLLTGTASAAAAEQPHYPVPYTLAAGIPAALHPYASPPGSNDWSCRPSAGHPEPVVLVHGLGANKDDNWQTFSPLLADEGYCVFALTYGVPAGNPFPLDQVGGLERMQYSAHELSAFVDRILAATGAQQVDILGHSEGTLMPDYYVKFLGGAAKVDDYVSLAPLWHGTKLAGLATLSTFATAAGFDPVLDGAVNPLCASCRQFLSGSQFLDTLGDPAVPGVDYTNIVTRYDELVVPYTSGIQSGMTNIVVQHQCSLDHADHLAIAADPVAAADVLNALDPAHLRPVPCTLVLPFVG